MKVHGRENGDPRNRPDGSRLPWCGKPFAPPVANTRWGLSNPWPGSRTV